LRDSPGKTRSARRPVDLDPATVKVLRAWRTRRQAESVRVVRDEITFSPHPPTYAVREERILAVVDHWLGTFADPDHIDATVQSIVEADNRAEAEPAEVTQARQSRHRLEIELDRLIAAIRAGMDPKLAAPQTREVQARSEVANSTIQRWGRSDPRVAPLIDADVRILLADTATPLDCCKR
jgi:hypothetical protein